MNEAESPRGRGAQAPKLHHAVFVSYSSDEGIAVLYEADLLTQ